MALRFECLYGPPGEGKSSAVLALVQHIWKTTGKRTRVYVGDGSTATYVDSGLVDMGVVELFEYTALPEPLSVTQHMCDRWWPNEAGELVPPVQAELDQVGLIVYEGLTVMSAYVMGADEGGLANRSGKGEKIGQDSPIQIKDKGKNGVTVGGNPISHFGVGQNHMKDCINRSKSKAFPGWVIWTAHERVAEDKTTGEKSVGPATTGGALTPFIPALFGNTLHFVTTSSKKKAKDPMSGKDVDIITNEYRMYTRDHYDADGTSFIKYKAVNRCAKPEMMPDYFTGKMGENILAFYKTLQDVRAQVEKELLAQPA